MDAAALKRLLVARGLLSASQVCELGDENPAQVAREILTRGWLTQAHLDGLSPDDRGSTERFTQVLLLPDSAAH